MLLGIAFLVIGLILTYAPGIFGWFGQLPGDIRIIKEKGRVFFPITSMIIVSIIVTILVNLYFRK